MAIDSEELIEEVRKYPYLWDKKNNGFRDVKMKNNRFCAIATLFKASSGDYIAKRWKGIRDRYLKERRDFMAKKTSGSGTDAVDPPKWKLYKILDGFLASTVEPRRTFCNIVNEDNEVDAGKLGQQSEEADSLFKSIETSGIESDIDESQMAKESNNYLSLPNSPQPTDDCTSQKISSSSSSSTTPSSTLASSDQSAPTSMASSSCGMSKPPLTKRKRVDDMDLKMVTLLDAATKNLANISSPKRVCVEARKEVVLNGNDHYFNSLKARFNDMPKDQQREIRFKIESLFYEIESNF